MNDETKQQALMLRHELDEWQNRQKGHLERFIATIIFVTFCFSVVLYAFITTKQPFMHIIVFMCLTISAWVFQLKKRYETWRYMKLKKTETEQKYNKAIKQIEGGELSFARLNIQSGELTQSTQPGALEITEHHQ